MSFNNVPQLAAGGNIYPCRFIKGGASAHLALQAGANEPVIGISGTGVIDLRADAENLYHATTTYPTNLEVRGFGDADVPIETGGAFDAFANLKSDADGKAVVAQVGDNVGAIALESAAGTSGERVRVWILPQTGTGAVSAASADGAITQKTGQIYITKTSAAALTIAAPTATTDDGKTLTITSATAFAHTVTLATAGFNSSGTTADVATFDVAVRGASMTIRAYQGVWYTTNLRSVTLA